MFEGMAQGGLGANWGDGHATDASLMSLVRYALHAVHRLLRGHNTLQGHVLYPASPGLGRHQIRRSPIWHCELSASAVQIALPPPEQALSLCAGIAQCQPQRILHRARHRTICQQRNHLDPRIRAVRDARHHQLLGQRPELAPVGLLRQEDPDCALSPHK